MIFDSNHPTQPPDVIFSVEDDQMAFDPDVEKLMVRRSKDIDVLIVPVC